MELIILKFIKFCVVGATGLVIDFGLTYLLKEKVKTNKYFANSFGFLCAATSNYVLNRIWTFQSTDPAIFLQYTKFVVISLIGLGLNNSVIFLLHGKKNKNFYVSKAVAILVVVLWNFFANYFYTFANSF